MELHTRTNHAASLEIETVTVISCPRDTKQEVTEQTQ